MRVWITRSRPGAERTALAVAARGHDPVIAPVLNLRDLPASVPTCGALAFTSANAVAAFARLTTDRSAPVFAVGDATARAATEAGFSSVRSASGDGAALADLLAATAPPDLLWPCAADVAFDLAKALAGRVTVTALPVYQAQPAEPFPTIPFDAVVVQSPRAARILAGRLPPAAAEGRLALAVSAACAVPLQALPFAHIHVATHPDEAHLLAPLGKPARAV